MKWINRIAAVSAVSMTGMLLAACGGGASDSAESPLKIMALTANQTKVYNFPETWDSAKAWAESINAAGGIDGRDVEIIECNDHASPNESEKCAREAVSEKVVALIGFTQHTDRVLPVLEAAGIPWVGIMPIQTVDFESPISYGTTSVAVNIGALAAKSLEECKAPAVAALDYPAHQAIVNQFMTPVLKAAGKSWVANVKIPIDATDFAPYAAALAKADCVAGPLTEPFLLQLLPALEDAGGTQKIFAQATSLTQKAVDAAPQITNGAITSSSFGSVEDDVWADYRKAIVKTNAKLASSATEPSAHGRITWSSLEILRKAINGDGDIDSKGLKKTLDSMGPIETGVLPAIDFSKTTGVKGFDRLFNMKIHFGTVTGGNRSLSPTTDDISEIFVKALS